MSDISALTKARPDVQEQIKKLRNALDPSKKITSTFKTYETRDSQVEKIKDYLERINQTLAKQEKTAFSPRPVVIAENIEQFNDDLSPRNIESIFARSLSVSAEEIETFKSSPAEPFVRLEFSQRDYSQFAKMLVDNFALLTKQQPKKEIIVDKHSIIGKYTQKVIESRQSTQRFVSEVTRPIPSSFNDWFGGPGYNISHRMREEFSEYLHGKSTQPKAITRLKTNDKEITPSLGSINQNLSHLLQRTKASQERIFNKRSFVELLELLNSVRANGHNNSGFGSGR